MSGLVAALLAAPKSARAIALAGGALVALALLAGAGTGAWRWLDRANDREAVRDHEARVQAGASRAELEAERNANRNAEARRTAREIRTDALRDARETATDDPESRLVAGPAVRAVMRELRAQADPDHRPAR